MRLTRALLAVTAALAAGPAGADVFSPGPLSRPHQSLEGLGQCTRCHVAGQQLASSACLACHRELAPRIAERRGFHGRLPPAEREACQGCHHEHQGREFPLVDWGRGGRSGFDHGRTGVVLAGKHRRVECARCHDPRLVADPAVKEILRRQPARATLLGAPQRCAGCHFDEHRGQLGAECQRCHSEETWKPAPRFDHARAAYRLDGAHAKVACTRCHPAVDEPPRAAPPAVTAPARPAAFVRYRELPFQRCTDCHRDPHQDRFGATCTGCHTTAGWAKVIGAGAQRAFHDRTRYPLRGAHVRVSCQACHGPWPGAKARYRELASERCTDCHADAHLGQLPGAGQAGARAAPPQACDRCHDLEGFLPARYELADHARAAYPLEGAHRAVSCARCHPKDPRLAARVPASVRAELARKRRPLRVSLATFDLARPSDCRSCHRDPHAGQLEARGRAGGCAACHGLDSFRRIRLDHARDTRFPLAGKHARAACGSCHRPDTAGVVRYRPLPVSCGACHADVHAGQLTRPGADCDRCHGTEGWKPAERFVHAQPFTAFALEGKHQKAACERCHPAVEVGGAAVRRYRPLPARCQGCHADFHRGAFRGYAP